MNFREGWGRVVFWSVVAVVAVQLAVWLSEWRKPMIPEAPEVTVGLPEPLVPNVDPTHFTERKDVFPKPLVPPMKVLRVKDMVDNETAMVEVQFWEDGRACVWPEDLINRGGSSRLTKKGSTYHAVMSQEDIAGAATHRYSTGSGLCSILVVVGEKTK